MIRRLSAFLCVVAFGAAPARAEEEVLRVGVIFPMSGGTATYGEESWNGMKLAEEDLKKAKFPIPFKLILKDDKSEKQEAGIQAKALIDNDEVHVILGSVASSNTMQMAREASEAGVPLITPASTNDTLTEKGGPYISRICFKDSFQGTVLANFAMERGWKRAAVIVDKANAYSTGLSENFKTAYEAKGGKATFDYITQGDKEFSNVIQNVVNHAPDVIVFSGYYAEGGPMIKQAKGKWDGKPIIGGDGLDSPKLVDLVGDTKAEIYFSTHFAADAPDPEVQAFSKRYKDAYGTPPGAMAALGYDVLMVLMDAAKRAKNPRDQDALAKAIADTKGLKTITGTLDLTTPDRTPIKDVVIVKVDGGFKYAATIQAPK
jgi:branched-chain amino acid transport system substrate-binding protein